MNTATIDCKLSRLIKITLHLLLILPFTGLCQTTESWTNTPKEQWPQIALTNHVQFKNGDRYVDPSFAYAGNGFLIDTGTDTLAITVKHVLWVAKNVKTKTVQVNKELKSWIMKPKGEKPDSVVIDRLINEDSTESLDATILERDWLVFTIENAPPDIRPLKPRYTVVKPGENVYTIGYSYSDSVPRIYKGEVLRKLGMDILIEQFTGYPQGGTSGSPVIDANGFLIGIHSSSSSDPASRKNVTVAVGTEYLKDVLTRKTDLNMPKKDYGKLILETVLKKGTKKAIRQYNTLIRNPENYYIYNLWSAHRNGLRETGEKLMELKRFRDAVEILEFNVEMNPLFYRDYNILAEAWLSLGNRDEAIRNYTLSTARYDDKEKNEAFKELARLGVSR